MVSTNQRIVTKPRVKEDQLLSLELKADLGFAELVSATGISSFEAEGQRDQTDLLIRLDYGYEEFPAFSTFTREIDEVDTFTQELRLVSQSDSDFSWIVGGFYNKKTQMHQVENLHQVLISLRLITLAQLNLDLMH